MNAELEAHIGGTPKLNRLNEAVDMNNVPRVRALLKDVVPGYQPDGEVVDWVWMENERQTV